MKTDICTFMIICLSVLLKIRNILDKICRDILCPKNCFFGKRAVYEIMWENTVQPDSQQITIWRMRMACCLPKATNTHLEYVIQ